MIKVYGIPNCNTVKKAIDWLNQNKLSYEFHDYKKKGVTKDKLQEWSKHFGWENILNKKGTTWAKLTDEQKEEINSEKKVIDYLTENTSAIRRPIIEASGQYLIRFDEQQYADVLL
jgi:arsenate reductase (glutaredoxin)